MKYQECYKEGCKILTEAGTPEAMLDARLLLEYICQTTHTDLLVHGDREVEDAKLTAYRAAIAKRSERIPLQHITGQQEFMGLTFQVNEHVLIPRQDTEILVEEVMRTKQDYSRILDMCTGSGCILISLMHYRNWNEAVGVDISSKALEVARENAKTLLSPEKQPIWIESNLFEKVEGKFEVIVSNPPYIPTKVIDTLMPEVRLHEPMNALDGTEDGLYFYRRIAMESVNYLSHEGELYLEIGHDQAKAVGQLLAEAGFQNIQVVKDYAGLDRVVFGRLP